MEFTQQQRKEQESFQKIHERVQIDLLKKYENELQCLNEYIEEELVGLNQQNTRLFNWMNTCKMKIIDFADIFEKCQNSYHFGSEILFYYVENIIAKEVKAIKDASNNFSTSIEKKMKNSLFQDLNKVLETIPFTESVFKNVPLPLNEMLKTDYKEILESVKNYLNIGYALKDEIIIEKLKTELSKLNANASVASYYAAIIGPSFMGKTQTAFTLNHRMTVIYINLLIGSNTNSEELGTNQNIYKAFFSFSKFLNDIIDDDIKDIKDSGGNINASNFDQQAQQKIPLKTLGMIFVLLKMKMIRSDITILQWYKNIMDIENIWIPAMTVSNFIKAVRGKKSQILFLLIN